MCVSNEREKGPVIRSSRPSVAVSNVSIGSVLSVIVTTFTLPSSPTFTLTHRQSLSSSAVVSSIDSLPVGSYSSLPGAFFHFPCSNSDIQQVAFLFLGFSRRQVSQREAEEATRRDDKATLHTWRIRHLVPLTEHQETKLEASRLLALESYFLTSQPN